MKKKLLSLLLSLCICTSLLTGMASAAGFTDVKSTDYYAKPVEWAVGKSITNGTSATTFSPNQTCNNAQIITFLWRAAGCPASRLYSGSFNPFFDVPDDAWYLDAAKWAMGKIVFESNFKPDAKCTRASTVEFFWRAAGSPEVDPVPFSDVKADSQLEQAVSWAIRNGVTNGTSATTFSPNDTVTRGQIVTFLYRQYVAPLDNSELINGAPAPKQPTDYDGELDPLPPEDYKKGPAWYGSLTDVKKLSNARLIAELKRLQACMDDYYARGIFFNDPVYAREQDLLDEREDRGEIVAAYDYYVKGYWKDESIRIAYEELVAKYGPADPLRK